MKKTTVLKFSSLTDLALFLKTVEPKGYIINTVGLTLTATFTPIEYTEALNNFKAKEVKYISA